MPHKVIITFKTDFYNSVEDFKSEVFNATGCLIPKPKEDYDQIAALNAFALLKHLNRAEIQVVEVRAQNAP